MFITHKTLWSPYDNGVVGENSRGNIVETEKASEGREDGFPSICKWECSILILSSLTLAGRHSDGSCARQGGQGSWEGSKE